MTAKLLVFSVVVIVMVEIILDELLVEPFRLE